MIKSEISYLRQLISGKSQLSPIERDTVNAFDKFKAFIFVYLIPSLIITFIIVLPMTLLFPEIPDSYRAWTNTSFTELILWVVIVGPPLEELMFRLPLRFKKTNLKVWLFCVFLLSLNLFYLIPLALFFIWICYMFYSKNRLLDLQLMRFYRKYGVYLFWVSLLVFASMHIYNYDLESLPVTLYPIAVLPQVCSGLLFAIVRIRMGFWLGVLHHVLFNLILILISQ